VAPHSDSKETALGSFAAQDLKLQKC